MPRFSKTAPCEWRKRRSDDGRYVWLPFDVMIDVMDFALDHAIVRMPDGTLKRQKEGIPMGDPLSPAMTIITCAWMENEWMKTVAARVQLLAFLR